MQEGREFDTDFQDEQGVFHITSIESRSERWHQVARLTLGVVAIWLGYETASWASDPATASVRFWTLAVVGFGMLQVGRAMSRFVVSVSARQARVFRWRHLAACGVCLVAITVALVSVLLVREPFGNVLSHGNITGGDIADVGFIVAAGFCLLGAITALIAAVAELRSEHRWRRPPVPHPSG